MFIKNRIKPKQQIFRITLVFQFNLVIPFLLFIRPVIHLASETYNTRLFQIMKGKTLESLVRGETKSRKWLSGKLLSEIDTKIFLKKYEFNQRGVVTKTDLELKKF